MFPYFDDVNAYLYLAFFPRHSGSERPLTMRQTRDERGKSLFSLHFELRAILNNELLAKATFTFWEDYTDRNVDVSAKSIVVRSVRPFSPEYFS